MYLTENPFYILGVTTRDNKQTIIEKAENISFDIDHDICIKARADLTHSRKRLAAEMAWLPRVSIKKSHDILRKAIKNPETLIAQYAAYNQKKQKAQQTASTYNQAIQSGFVMNAENQALYDEAKSLISNKYNSSHLTILNSITSCIINATSSEDYDFEHIICGLSTAFEEIDSSEIMRQINADRSVSGFPKVQDISWIEKELVERRRHYVKSIMKALNNLPSLELIETVTLLVEGNTDGGESPAESLIGDIVDRYEESTYGFLEKEADNVRSQIKVCRNILNNSGTEDQVDDRIDKLLEVLKNWDNVAQPIQLIAQSRGIDHSMSNDLSSDIRNLAVELHNEYGLTESAKWLTEELGGVFAEAPNFVEQLDEDSTALEDILRHQKEEEQKSAQWVKTISFEAEIGKILKKKLKISPEGILWGKKNYPLDSISGVLWGAKSTAHSINGIQTGTTSEYVIKFTGTEGSVTIKPSSRLIYDQFVEKFWQAVCVRILIDLIQKLSQGDMITIGKVRVSDQGIDLIKHGFFKRKQPVFSKWSEVTIGKGNGSFRLIHRSEKKTYIELPYMEIYNAHILEAAIRIFWKKGGTNLSSAFQD